MPVAKLESYQDSVPYVVDSTPALSVIEHMTFSQSTNGNYVLKRPMTALVSKTSGEYKVEYPPLELYAFSKDKNEAIREFMGDFFDLCEDILPMDDAGLGRYPKSWKDELHTLVKRNDAD